MHKILGLKLVKREPMFDKHGVQIDDGINREMTLCSTDDERLANFFFTSVKARVDSKVWKIWKV